MHTIPYFVCFPPHFLRCPHALQLVQPFPSCIASVMQCIPSCTSNSCLLLLQYCTFVQPTVTRPLVTCFTACNLSPNVPSRPSSMRNFCTWMNLANPGKPSPLPWVAPPGHQTTLYYFPVQFVALSYHDLVWPLRIKFCSSSYFFFSVTCLGWTECRLSFPGLASIAALIWTFLAQINYKK